MSRKIGSNEIIAAEYEIYFPQDSFGLLNEQSPGSQALDIVYPSNKLRLSKGRTPQAKIFLGFCASKQAVKHGRGLDI
jgi:hypothetical protein